MGTPPGSSWRDALTRSRALLPQLVIYDLAFKLLWLSVLAPAGAWVLDRLIERSGALAVTNTEIIGFLISPPGIAFLVLTVAFSLTASLAELSGLVAISAAPGDEPRRWIQALTRTILDLPKLASTALAAAGIALVAALPLAAIAAAAHAALLGAHDINWYLSERPPALWAAAGIGVLLALLAAAMLAVALVRWSLVVPVVQNERLSGRAALRRSRQLVATQRARATRLVLGWIGGSLLVTALILGALRWFGSGMLGLADGADARIAIAAIWLGLLAIAGTLLSFIAFSGYGILVSRLYDDLAESPARIAAPSAAHPRLGPRFALALLGVVVVVSALMVHRQIEALELGRSVSVTAHRGSSAKAPENSLSAIRQAIADRADFAEIDVQESADGELVLLHDSDLMRVAGLPRKIWEVDYAEIRDLDAGSWFSPEFAAERIPTLDQAIETARGRIALNIEIKLNGHDQRLAEAVAETVAAAGFAEQCIITSLDRDALARVRQSAPQLVIGQIVTVAVGDPRRLDLDLLSMESAQATPAAVRANRAAGLETHVWTVNDRAGMERMIARGIDNIITDEPELLRSLIDERAGRSDVELLLLALSTQLKH